MIKSCLDFVLFFLLLEIATWDYNQGRLQNTHGQEQKRISPQSWCLTCNCSWNEHKNTRQRNRNKEHKYDQWEYPSLYIFKFSDGQYLVEKTRANAKLDNSLEKLHENQHGLMQKHELADQEHTHFDWFC